MTREANAKKMHDAQTGGSGTGLGPSQMDQAQIKQRGAIASQAATAGSEEAQIAQAQQTSQSGDRDPLVDVQERSCRHHPTIGSSGRQADEAVHKLFSLGNS